MHILQLCKKFPYPLKDGESIAVHYMAKGLVAAGAKISLLVMNTTKHFYEIEGYPVSKNVYEEIISIPLDNRIHLKGALNNLFSGKSYHLSRYDIPEFHAALAKLLNSKTFDVVLLETFYLSPYVKTIRKNSKALVVLRSHNVEHEIWKRVSDQTKSFVKASYLKMQTRRLERAEKEYLNSYDLFLAISDKDLRSFKEAGLQIESKVLPIGLNLSDFNFSLPDSVPEEPFRIGFIGSLDWLPNLEGLQWFWKVIWPHILKEQSKIEFHIAGRNTPDWLKHEAPEGVRIHGEVDDAHEFVKSCHLSVVPLLSGSGMRVKILESMALGRPVLSTKVGIEGISARHGEEAFIGSSPEEFIEALKNLANDPSKLSQVAKQGRKFVESHFDYQVIARNLHQSLQNKTAKD